MYGGGRTGWVGEFNMHSIFSASTLSDYSAFCLNSNSTMICRSPGRSLSCEKAGQTPMDIHAVNGFKPSINLSDIPLKMTWARSDDAPAIVRETRRFDTQAVETTVY